MGDENELDFFFVYENISEETRKHYLPGKRNKEKQLSTEKGRNIFKKAGVAKTEKKKRKDYYTNIEKLKLNYKKLRNINKPSYMQEHAKNAENEHKSDREHEHADINGPTRLTQCENHGNGGQASGRIHRIHRGWQSRPDQMLVHYRSSADFSPT